MNENRRALLAVGTRLAYDGQWWQVSELDDAVLASQIRQLEGVTSTALLTTGQDGLIT